jgi:hypothetical protein
VRGSEITISRLPVFTSCFEHEFSFIFEEVVIKPRAKAREFHLKALKRDYLLNNTDSLPNEEIA